MDHPDAAGEVFNIGSTQEVSITHLAERILALTGSRSEIVYVPYSEAYEEGFEDMPRRVPDISKAERFIGFTPRTSLDDILREVIRDRTRCAAESFDLAAYIE
jgi:UDP-glucose 4-epimerase